MITKEDVIKVANLSKFELTESEIEQFQGQLNNLLNIIEKLNDVNTENIEPLYSPLQASNVLREDSVVASSKELIEDILENSKYYIEGKVTIPQVVS